MNSYYFHGQLFPNANLISSVIQNCRLSHYYFRHHSGYGRMYEKRVEWASWKRPISGHAANFGSLFCTEIELIRLGDTIRFGFVPRNVWVFEYSFVEGQKCQRLNEIKSRNVAVEQSFAWIMHFWGVWRWRMFQQSDHRFAFELKIAGQLNAKSSP